MSQRIDFGYVLRSPSGQHWEVVRRAEDNLTKGVLKVMLTLRLLSNLGGSRREIQRSELHLQRSCDAGLWQLLKGDALLGTLGTDES